MFKYISMYEGDLLPDMQQLRPFKCVVLISGAISSSWRAAVSRWLVESGCMYMMAWGAECSAWDDSVDNANLKQYSYGEIPCEGFVLTTWHDKDSLEDLFFFARHTAHHPATKLDNVMVLDIGQSGREQQLQTLYELA